MEPFWPFWLKNQFLCYDVDNQIDQNINVISNLFEYLNQLVLASFSGRRKYDKQSAAQLLYRTVLCQRFSTFLLSPRKCLQLYLPPKANVTFYHHFYAYFRAMAVWFLISYKLSYFGQIWHILNWFDFIRGSTMLIVLRFSSFYMKSHGFKSVWHFEQFWGDISFNSSYTRVCAKIC